MLQECLYDICKSVKCQQRYIKRLASLFQASGMIRAKGGPGLVRALLQRVKSPCLCVGITHFVSYYCLMERQVRTFSWSAVSSMPG